MISRYALFFGICLALPTSAQAQMSDGAQRQGMGLRDPDTIIEVWVTARNGDWVIVQNYANGTSCIVAMGAHWEGSVANPA